MAKSTSKVAIVTHETANIGTDRHESVKTRSTGIIVRQANEEHLRMGQNRHRHYARLLRLPRLLLFLYTDGGLADVGTYRSFGRDAPPVASIMHRRLRYSSERRLLHPDRRVHVQPGHLSARHQERRCDTMQASLTIAIKISTLDIYIPFFAKSPVRSYFSYSFLRVSSHLSYLTYKFRPLTLIIFYISEM